MPAYEVVIGLEVHVQMATQSKMFCSCPNHFGDEPNSNVCEVCAGMPGVLPSINRKAVEYATRMAMAVSATVNDNSIFARKNYFYPDLPKGYQISQFERPLCEHGYLDIAVNGKTKRIGITRIHMEDDAGKNIHGQGENQSYVDLNRAGTPLMEIVSEPELSSAEEAVAYLKGLHSLVTNLGISDGNMEEGSFRCDANVSLRPVGSPVLGTRTELKNLNSFRNVQKAIEIEISRQQGVLEDGLKVVQETRLFDSVKNITLSMRSKEEAQDYRYFPDPDLLPVHISPEELEAWKDTQPELPAARMARFMQTWNLAQQDAEFLAYDRALAHFFEAAVAACPEAKKIVNLIQGPLLRELNSRNVRLQNVEDIPMQPQTLAQLVQMIDEGKISAKIASDIFPELYETGAMPQELVQQKGLMQISDSSAIDSVVQAILEANPAEVEAYRAGKTKLISFFVGQVMREMRGKANPAMVNEALQRLL